MDSTLTLVIIIAALVLGGALVWYLQQQRSRHLRRRFGPEYERTRNETGDARRAEERLAQREQRVEKFHIRSLTPDERSRYSEVWRHVQKLFVDDPKGAINEADHLVNEVMSTKGYPMADFKQRSDDISVDHPVVVQHYRIAVEIADRNRANAATTEDLRQAVIHYRALFEDLLEEKPSERKPSEQHVHARR
jgi:hypothetical protein